MSKIYLIVFVLISLSAKVIPFLLGSECDYKKYTVNGCEDELGADCERTTNQCRCKPDNQVVLDNRFCFPIQCPKGQYYDHNYVRCEPQRKATLDSRENYCKYDFNCRGENIYCQHLNEWNHRCVCKEGFGFDANTQECQRVEGIYGFCRIDKDCDESGLRHLVCVNHSCQCPQDFTYNINIDGCESNKEVLARDSQTRKMMYLFIGLGLFFGAALSLKFGTNSAASTQQMLLKQIIERRSKEREQQRQQQLEGQELQQEIAVDLESTDKTENLINNRETA